MISQQAKEGFDYMLTTALKSSMSASPEEPVEIVPIDDTAQIKEKSTILLTVSSYLFRVVTLIHFTLDKTTKQHFAALSKRELAEMDQDAFLDVISECGNICCGALNRELSHHFPHIGMSTPNLLDRNCLDYLQDLDAGYIRHFKINIHGGLTMHASLCVCDHTDIDFSVDMTQEEECNGELEMF